MNSDREPASSPAQRREEMEMEAEVEVEELDNGDVSDSNCGESYTPADGSEGKDDDSDVRDDEDDEDDDDDDDDDHDGDRNDSDVPSSPPTSVETGSKNDQQTEISTDGYHAPAVETEDEEDTDGVREYFTHHYEPSHDTFSAHRKAWENSSQWEDEDGSPARATLSSPPPARVQSQSSSRKSPAPSSPMFPPRPRQANSTKSHLGHQFTHRPSPTSSASSGSYDAREPHRDEKKPPLVLLHVTLLLLPGTEEVVLRHLTPTTFERGVLVEHPRGDYNLLEELILDGLGLDDDFVPDTTEPEEPAEKTWEQALNILPSPPMKKAWQLRVYASNGLMTPGAWKRVWTEMERIDVEIWPRGYDRNGKSNRSSIGGGGGGHSRATSISTSSVLLPYPLDSAASAADEPDYDDRRKSLIGATAVRHGSGGSSSTATVLTSPTSPTRSRSRTPTTTVAKSRRTRSRAPAQGAGFDFNTLLTPRAVVVYAGINVLLFLYLTVFRVVNFGGAWSSSVAMFRAGEMDGVLVQEVEVEERCPVEVSSVVEAVAEVTEVVVAEVEVNVEVEVEVEDVDVDVEDVDVEVGAEERVLAGDEESDETVPDPEIGSEDQDAQVPITEDTEPRESGEEETTIAETLEGDLEQVLDEDAVAEDETEVDEESLDTDGDAEATVQEEEEVEELESEAEAEAEAEAEVEVEVDAEVEAEVEVEVEEKPKYGFLKGFGFS